MGSDFLWWPYGLIHGLIQLSRIMAGTKVFYILSDQYEVSNTMISVVLLTLFVLFSLVVFLVVALFKIKRVEEDLRDKNESLQYLADHDLQTDLFNRRYLLTFLQDRLVDANEPLTALYAINIINLKVINDTYGHEIGEKVLRHVASMVNREYASVKECVGYHQGEIYVVDTTVKSKDEIRSRAIHTIKLLSHVILVDYMEIEIKVNIGIAYSPEHSMDASMLLKKASIALVEAEKTAPNHYHVFEDGLYKDILKRMTLEKQLRRALYLEEFVLHFQPRINTKTMKVNGCEALIRWQHPDGHLVYPNYFIPLAEEVGFIEEISVWVVKAVMNQVKAWSENGHDIKVSFNISGKEFDDDFVERFQEILLEIEGDPRLLEVEITETAALKDLQHSKDLVDMLNKIGVTVSLDDFGTGYSSMTYIKKLRASKLKIDKSFIDQLDDYEQRVVVDTMIQLGKKLDYDINVEGVETIQQLKILKDLGVDEIQGWLFSKAIPAEDFIEFVETFDGKHFLG